MISVSVVICDFPDEGSLLVWICLELLLAEMELTIVIGD